MKRCLKLLVLITFILGTGSVMAGPRRMPDDLNSREQRCCRLFQEWDRSADASDDTSAFWSWLEDHEGRETLNLCKKEEKKEESKNETLADNYIRTLNNQEAILTYASEDNEYTLIVIVEKDDSGNLKNVLVGELTVKEGDKLISLNGFRDPDNSGLFEAYISREKVLVFVDLEYEIANVVLDFEIVDGKHIWRKKDVIELKLSKTVRNIEETDGSPLHVRDHVRIRNRR